MHGPPIQWHPMKTLDNTTRDGQLVTLRVGGRPVLACWHTDSATGRSFWWNGDVTEEGGPIETCNPSDWALVDLDAYRTYYEGLTDRGITPAS